MQWDERSSAVQALRTRSYGALVIESAGSALGAPGVGLGAMLDGVRQMGIGSSLGTAIRATCKPGWSSCVHLESSRIAPTWPASDDASLLKTLNLWLSPWIEGMTRKEHLGRVPLADALMAASQSAPAPALSSSRRASCWCRQGPKSLSTTGMRRGPSIAVRLQEVFGLAETPRIGVEECRSPSSSSSRLRGRPVQITQDLAGFWKSSYREVRKEMRGRYPKHPWPEDPLSAPPSRGARRR